MTDDLIARATAALEGVTEGPWRASLLDGIDYEDGSSCIRGGVYPDVHGSAPVFLSSSGIDRRDARFIAAARTLVPELLAEVERLRGALNEVRALADDAAGKGWRDLPSQSMDEAAGMQTVGETILLAVDVALRGDQ